jgi:hypothetical protein
MVCIFTYTKWDVDLNHDAHPQGYAKLFGVKKVVHANHCPLAVVIRDQHPFTLAFSPFVWCFEQKEPVYTQGSMICADVPVS